MRCEEVREEEEEVEGRERRLGIRGTRVLQRWLDGLCAHAGSSSTNYIILLDRKEMKSPSPSPSPSPSRHTTMNDGNPYKKREER